MTSALALVAPPTALAGNPKIETEAPAVDPAVEADQSSTEPTAGAESSSPATDSSPAGLDDFMYPTNFAHLAKDGSLVSDTDLAAQRAKGDTNLALSLIARIACIPGDALRGHGSSKQQSNLNLDDTGVIQRQGLARLGLATRNLLATLNPSGDREKRDRLTLAMTVDEAQFKLYLQAVNEVSAGFNTNGDYLSGSSHTNRDQALAALETAISANTSFTDAERDSLRRVANLALNVDGLNRDEYLDNLAAASALIRNEQYIDVEQNAVHRAKAAIGALVASIGTKASSVAAAATLMGPLAVIPGGIAEAICLRFFNERKETASLGDTIKSLNEALNHQLKTLYQVDPENANPPPKLVSLSQLNQTYLLDDPTRSIIDHAQDMISRLESETILAPDSTGSQLSPDEMQALQLDAVRSVLQVTKAVTDIQALLRNRDQHGPGDQASLGADTIGLYQQAVTDAHRLVEALKRALPELMVRDMNWNSSVSLAESTQKMFELLEKKDPHNVQNRVAIANMVAQFRADQRLELSRVQQLARENIAKQFGVGEFIVSSSWCFLGHAGSLVTAATLGAALGTPDGPQLVPVTERGMELGHFVGLEAQRNAGQALGTNALWDPFGLADRFADIFGGASEGAAHVVNRIFGGADQMNLQWVTQVNTDTLSKIPFLETILSPEQVKDIGNGLTVALTPDQLAITGAEAVGNTIPIGELSPEFLTQWGAQIGDLDVIGGRTYNFGLTPFGAQAAQLIAAAAAAAATSLVTGWQVLRASRVGAALPTLGLGLQGPLTPLYWGERPQSSSIDSRRSSLNTINEPNQEGRVIQPRTVEWMNASGFQVTVPASNGESSIFRFYVAPDDLVSKAKLSEIRLSTDEDQERFVSDLMARAMESELQQDAKGVHNLPISWDASSQNWKCNGDRIGEYPNQPMTSEWNPESGELTVNVPQANGAPLDYVFDFGVEDFRGRDDVQLSSHYLRWSNLLSNPVERAALSLSLVTAIPVAADATVVRVPWKSSSEGQLDMLRLLTPFRRPLIGDLGALDILSTLPREPELVDLPFFGDDNYFLRITNSRAGSGAAPTQGVAIHRKDGSRVFQTDQTQGVLLAVGAGAFSDPELRGAMLEGIVGELESARAGHSREEDLDEHDDLVTMPMFLRQAFHEVFQRRASSVITVGKYQVTLDPQTIDPQTGAVGFSLNGEIEGHGELAGAEALAVFTLLCELYPDDKKAEFLKACEDMVAAKMNNTRSA